MEKLYWTIGEVAEMLGESVPLVRSWADGFPELVRPARNAGAAKQLEADRTETERRVKVLERLKNIRSRLEEIKKNS